MNVLSYKFFDQNGGSFELFVDDVSLAEQVNYEDSLIPYRLIDNGIPTFPPHESKTQMSERIVAVCSCGEYGCDCIICKVEIENEFVIFRDFERPGYTRLLDKTFKFSKENFQKVENQLAIDIEKIKKGFENQN